MKFFSPLPDAKHFKLEKSQPGRYTFLDKAFKGSREIVIISPHPNPFAIKQWLLVAGHEKNKSDDYEYPTRLRIKLIPESEAVGDFPKGFLFREISKGDVWCSAPASQGYRLSSVLAVVPVEAPAELTGKIKENLWLSYSVYLVEREQ